MKGSEEKLRRRLNAKRGKNGIGSESALQGHPLHILDILQDTLSVPNTYMHTIVVMYLPGRYVRLGRRHCCSLFN